MCLIFSDCAILHLVRYKSSYHVHDSFKARSVNERKTRRQCFGNVAMPIDWFCIFFSICLLAANLNIILYYWIFFLHKIDLRNFKVKRRLFLQLHVQWYGNRKAYSLGKIKTRLQTLFIRFSCILYQVLMHSLGPPIHYLLIISFKCKYIVTTIII